MKTKRWSQDIFLAIFFIAFCLFMLNNAKTKMNAEAAMFPIGILVIVLALSMALLIKGIRDTRAYAKGKDFSDHQLRFDEIKTPLIVFCIIALYVVGIDLIGFIIPSLVFMFAMLLFNFVKNKLVFLLLPIGLVGFIYVLFTYILSARLP